MSKLPITHLGSCEVLVTSLRGVGVAEAVEVGVGLKPASRVVGGVYGIVLNA